MGNSVKFCRKCGKELPISAKFCRYCGADLSVSVSDSKVTLNINEVNAASSEQSGKKGQRERNGKKSAGKRVIAGVLAAALLFTAFVNPGFLRKKKKENGLEILQNERDYNDTLSGTILKTEYNTELIAEGKLTPEENSISQNGVSVTVETGFLRTERNITISRVTDAVSYSFDGEEEVPLSVYEVEIDGIKDGSMITIELPMDKNAASEYGAGYIDEQTHRLKPALCKYDSDSGILTIHTTHLSKFCGIPVKNENTRNAALAYISSYDLYDDESIEDYHTLMSLLETSLESGSNIECGMSILDILSMVQGGASVMKELIAVPGAKAVSTIAEGAGDILYMGGNSGTIGEIMNTNWGKAGTWSLSAEPGKTATRIVGYDETLKTVYPTKVIDKIGDALTNAGRILTLYKLTKNIVNEGWTARSTGTEAIKWAAAEAIGLYVKYGTYTAGLGVYMIGVSAFALALDYVTTTLQEGRKEVYIHAYTKYYGGDGHRTDDDWIARFQEIMKAGGGNEEIQAEIDAYVNQFWDEADRMGIDYYANVMTEDDRAAWGISTAQGLTPEIRKEISENYKARLVTKRMPDIFAKLENQNKMALIEKYQDQIDSLRRMYNQKITLQITSEDVPSDENGQSRFAGCTVRFKDLAGKVSDLNAWETVLNREGSGSISFTLLAHMVANAGTEIEIVRKGEDGEEILLADSFIFKEQSGYDYPKLSCNYVIKGIPQEEQEESIGDYPEISVDMKIKSVFGEKVYTNPAFFTLDGNGEYTIEIPAQDLDSLVTYNSEMAHERLDNIHFTEFDFKGDFGTDSTVSYSDGIIKLTSRDVKMDNDMVCTCVQHGVYYPNSENPLEYNADCITTMQFKKEKNVATSDADYSYIILSVEPTPESGAVLRIQINTVLNRSVSTREWGDNADAEIETDEVSSTSILEKEIDNDTYLLFQKCFGQ